MSRNMKAVPIPQADAEEMMRDAAKLIELCFPGYGFCLLVFDRDAATIGNYISNCERESMIEALEEKVRIFKENRDFKIPTDN
jgi:hypothetical protein